MAIFREKIASLTEQLESRKYQCQVDLAQAQEKNIALTDQLEALKTDFQTHHNSYKETQADLRKQLTQQAFDKQEAITLLKDKALGAEKMLDDSKRIQEELRVQLSLRDSESTVSLSTHEVAITAQETRIKDQENTISNLCRQANTLADRHKDGHLACLTILVHCTLTVNVSL